MTPELAARLIQGAHAGSIVLTATEAVIFLRVVHDQASVIVDARPVVLKQLPLHVLPDTPAMLREVPS